MFPSKEPNRRGHLPFEFFFYILKTDTLHLAHQEVYGLALNIEVSKPDLKYVALTWGF